MGQDKLGDNIPEDNLHIVLDGKNYGFPYCYEYKTRIIADAVYNKSAKRIDCKDVPQSFVDFVAHSSPLDLEYFDSKETDARLKQSFLVALHGSSKRNLHRGYRLVRVRQGHAPENFITGFIQGVKVLGRPAGILQMSDNAFLFTDDYSGRVFYVFKKGKGQSNQPEPSHAN
jgi:glucose/arabinose dehydrogenase